jgi:hypothetical protein
MDSFDPQTKILKIPKQEDEKVKMYTLLNRDENEKTTLPVD